LWADTRAESKEDKGITEEDTLVFTGVMLGDVKGANPVEADITCTTSRLCIVTLLVVVSWCAPVVKADTDVLWKVPEGETNVVVDG
jgi:hypothetical protein